jgi:hypothetical protein
VERAGENAAVAVSRELSFLEIIFTKYVGESLKTKGKKSKIL